MEEKWHPKDWKWMSAVSLLMGKGKCRIIRAVSLARVRGDVLETLRKPKGSDKIMKWPTWISQEQVVPT